MTGLRRRMLFALAMSERFESAVARVPGGRDRGLRLARRYVAGTTVGEALGAADDLTRRGLGVSLDAFGEQVRDRAEARRTADEYLTLIGELPQRDGDIWLAIDLSHIGVDCGVEFCAGLLGEIAAALPGGRRLQVGAEDATRADAILEVCERVAGNGGPLTITLQANLRRSADDVARVAAIGVPVRLVKGAYVEASSVALPYGAEVDAAYLRLAGALREAGIAVIAATHDLVLQEALRELPVEMLLGIDPERADALVVEGRPVRVYVPYGEMWWRYWMRRVAEAQGA